MTDNLMTWLGIILCLTQSAMFSGLTIGFFGLSRLRLEVETATKDKDAFKILQLRKDSNFLLATLLWGNVGVNVLLTLLTDSVLTGLGAFAFSTIGITIFGEIMPQAYMSRNAMSVGVKLIPVVKFYQALLFPVAKPTAYILDKWLGKEAIKHLREEEVIALLKKHIKAFDSDVDFIEGLGAINFLTLDDIKVIDEGELVDPKSIVQVPFKENKPIFPDMTFEPKNVIARAARETEKKWILLVDEQNEPRYVLNADSFMRHVARSKRIDSLLHYCHKPIIVKDVETRLGEVIRKFTVHAEHVEDDVVDQDIILYWNTEKRIITGADILGRLLRGIANKAVKAV